MVDRVSGMSRRSFVAGAGGIAGAATLTSLGWPRFLEQALAAPQGFTSARKATYSRALEAIAIDRASGSPGWVADTVSRFESYYNRLPRDFQLTVERILDKVEIADGATPLSARSVADVRALLTQWQSARTAAERAWEQDAAAKTRQTAPAGTSTLPEVRTYLEGLAQTIRAARERIRRELGDDALELHPTTGLLRYEPPPPTEPIFWPATLEAPEAQQRFLAAAIYIMVDIPFAYDYEVMTGRLLT